MPNVGELTFEESISRQFGLRCIVSDQALHNYVFDNMWEPAYTREVSVGDRDKIPVRTNLCHIQTYQANAPIAEFSGSAQNFRHNFVTGWLIRPTAPFYQELTNDQKIWWGATTIFQKDFGHGLTTILYFGNLWSNGIDRGVGHFDPRYYPDNDVTEASWVMEDLLRSMFNSDAPAWHWFYRITWEPTSVTRFLISDFNFKPDATLVGGAISQLADPLIAGTFPHFCLFTFSYEDANGALLPNGGFIPGTVVRVSAVEEDNLADLSYFDVQMQHNIAFNLPDRYFVQIGRIRSRPNRPIPLTQIPTRMKITGAPDGKSFEIWARDEGSSSIAVTLNENQVPVEQNVVNVLTRYDARLKPRQFMLLPNDIRGWQIENIRQVGRRKFMELELRR